MDLEAIYNLVSVKSIDHSQDALRIPSTDDPPRPKQTQLEAGHALMDTVRDNMVKYDDNAGIWVRSPDQAEIMDIYQKAICGIVYKDLMRTHLPDILEYNGFDECTGGLVVSAPRRFGKTLCIAIWAAILLVSIPGIEMLVISQDGKAADKNTGILGAILRILKTIFNVKEFDRKNQFQIAIQYSPTDVRFIKSYSLGSNNALVYNYTYP